MTFYVEKDDGIKELELEYDVIFEKVAREALLYTSCPYECEINLTLTDNDGIHEMNREFRHIDSPTDVLSFPMIEFDVPADFSGVEADYQDCFNPETGELMLGDIVISTDRVLIQADDYGHSVMREFAFLIAHSMLHLQGFDHMEPQEAAAMEKAQNTILNELDIRR